MYEFITTLSPQVIFLFLHSWSSTLVLHIPEEQMTGICYISIALFLKLPAS